MGSNFSCIDEKSIPIDPKLELKQRNSSKVIPRRQISRMDTPSTVWKRYFQSLEVSGVETNTFY